MFIETVLKILLVGVGQVRIGAAPGVQVVAAPARYAHNPIADPSSAKVGEPDMPPGPRRMHRIDDACAGYELDPVALAA